MAFVGEGTSTASTAADRNRPKRWIYRNLTPWRIEATSEAMLSIPALGEVIIPGDVATQLDTLEMRRRGQIELRPAPGELGTNLPRLIVIFGWLIVALATGAWALLRGGGGAVPWAAVVFAAVAVPVSALVFATVRELVLHRRFRKYCESKTDNLEGVERGGRIRGFVDGMPRHLAEVAVLLGAIGVSVVGLGVAIHLTTQLYELLPIDYGALLQLDNPFAPLSPEALGSVAFWQMVVARAAQWILVSVAALAPAAMYFQFDRQRLASLQRRWIQEVFRLDPSVKTVRDIEARYGSQIEVSFGELGPDSGLRLSSGRRSPVIVATILLVVGWFIVLSATQVPNLELVNGEYVWPLVADGSRPFPVPSFFLPQLTAIGYAFLGAYVFTLFHVLRGYQRRDLHPKSYNTVVVRILAAYALGVVVSLTWSGPAVEVILFFVGFMPESALVWLREQIAVEQGWRHRLPLHEPAPLTHLEGIDLYDRTRLAEEGINNVEGLAHADIVQLMSSTRISAAQLVDWTDQALLYLRVGGDARQQCPNEEHKDCCPDVRQNLCRLRALGIRTATDLYQAYQSYGQQLRDAVKLSADPATGVHPLDTMVTTLADEEWFAQVKNWRLSQFGDLDAWSWYLTGDGWHLAHETNPPGRQDPIVAPDPDRIVLTAPA